MTTGHKCTNCGWPMLTRTEARRSYGRMMGCGLTADEAKQLSPRCYRCTSIIRERRESGTQGAVQAVKAAKAAI